MPITGLFFHFRCLLCCRLWTRPKQQQGGVGIASGEPHFLQRGCTATPRSTPAMEASAGGLTELLNVQQFSKAWRQAKEHD